MNDETNRPAGAVTVIAPAQRGDIVAISTDQILGRRDMIQKVVATVMERGIHYDVIPGTGGRLSLLKEGAEVLLSTFQIAVQPVITDLSTNDEVKFQVECRAVHQQTGAYLGSGVGVCSSNEEKYRWRAARSTAEYDELDGKMKRQRYERDGSKTKQVRASPWDAYQTIIAMATKRATVALAKTVLAASDTLKRMELEAKRGSRPPNRPPSGSWSGQQGRPAANTASQQPPAQRAAQTPSNRPPADPPPAAQSTPAATPPPPTLDEFQVETLYEMLDRSGIPETEILARLEVGHLREVEASRFDEVKALIAKLSP